MKIIQLRAENIKRLVVVEITPDGNVVQISGKNGSGKTSVLDCIWWALEGADAIQKQPIRDGQDKANIVLDFGEMVVERSFTKKGSYLRVTNADGMQFSSPQKVLDALIGKLTFDPLEFVHMKAGEQVSMLQALAGIDGDEVKTANQYDFDTRRDVNRDAKAARTHADAIKVDADAPTEKVDLEEMRLRVQQATEVNGEVKRMHQRHGELEERIQRAQHAILDLERQRDAIDLGVEPNDLTAMNEEYNAAAVGNEKFELAERKNHFLDDVKELEAESARLSDSIANRTSVFQAEVAAAELPIEGLGIDLERGVTFDHLPLDQASNAEQIRISTALAMALNPKVRVLRIKEGSLLDSTSLGLISAMAADSDYQIWIETVDDSGEVGIMLEDGMVVNRAEAAE